MTQRLNLGCGTRLHADWINIDQVPANPSVLMHDLAQGIPMPDESCDVVYSSHLIEHLNRDEALRLLRECYRVLVPSGIVRVVVPDLEQICRIYLEKLEAAMNQEGGKDNGEQAKHDHEWMVIELYDQAVREEPGGEMARYLKRRSVPNEAFVVGRLGEIARTLLNQRGSSTAAGTTRIGTRVYMNRIKHFIYKSLLPFLLGEQRIKSLQTARFRLSGEIHRWMYDRFSMGQLLMQAGFQNPTVQTAVRSWIPNWSDYHLDTLEDGSVIKPESLFMEAIKGETQMEGSEV